MGTDTIFENDGDPRRHHHDSDERGATSGSDPFGHGSGGRGRFCLLYTSPSPRDGKKKKKTRKPPCYSKSRSIV
ncbi:hypothetical protein FRIG_15420 [Frigoribacterium faeni]|uniref:hypothetical protein n=1 Tax=Frigoribacterium faeni TaxID=145483 RepID=UPI001FAB768C|nr:hypothetical protein [Frigoribacterium faeni]MCJ0702505.1 hypothetical protein [Frigoribacterium faeni]